ncbi:regulator of G protein signaling domain-containing protein [Zychaea mexicana]|uniref:regulator of G protein signaling domain-containing protein n=1 Tax=Zychaea mexicana TaxID=64656 RepID=UPI0022FEF3ED|nr:regulator of G protein signaling domain-containing protein [Zychaea mexicana]KAI9492391.1 regulator of G protein signaling domain-containing protein [Zychaea mexicana]
MDPGVSQQAYTSMMKFTIDGRPYLKDIHDLFAALIVQIPLDTHRYLFRNYPNTFTSEDAILALGSLRFSHTARMPDPNDPSKLLRTTTTTTFNMEKDMAKALCQQFQQCRLTENATDPHSRSFRDKGIWQLTPKGVCVLQDFCVRTEADMAQLRRHFGHIDPIQLVRLERHADDDQIIFGRQNLSVVFRIMMTCLPQEGELEKVNNQSTKATSSSSSTRGGSGKSTISGASSQSSGSTNTSNPAPFAMTSNISSGDSRVQLLANNLLTHSKRGSKGGPTTRSAKNMRTVFSTQLACDWLTEYSTVSSREEAETIVNEFLKYGWIEFQDPKQSAPARASKTIMLIVTGKGKEVVAEFEHKAGAAAATQQQSVARSSSTSSLARTRSLRSQSTIPSSVDEEDQQTTLREILSQDPEAIHDPPSATPARPTRSRQSTSSSSRPSSTAIDYPEDPKESNAARLKVILDDPQLRSLFKDFLRANFCEENLDFWIDYSTLRRKCRNQSPAMPSQNQKDLLEDAHDIWSTYLAPGARCELNVEHSLRQEMARVVNSMVQVVPTFTPGQAKPTVVISTHSTSSALRMMLKWFDRVNEHICRLMASDSVPKFVKTPRYRKINDSREREQQKQVRKQQDSVVDSELFSSPSFVENKA